MSRAAVALGGGGHRYAAGFEAAGDPARIVADILAVLSARQGTDGTGGTDDVVAAEGVA